MTGTMEAGGPEEVAGGAAINPVSLAGSRGEDEEARSRRVPVNHPFGFTHLEEVAAAEGRQNGDADRWALRCWLDYAAPDGEKGGQQQARHEANHAGDACDPIATEKRGRDRTA